jgi:hypothetical protein
MRIYSRAMSINPKLESRNSKQIRIAERGKFETVYREMAAVARDFWPTEALLDGSYKVPPVKKAQ